MIATTVEVLGFGLILAFLWFVWPPLVLLGAGLVLIVYANAAAIRGGWRIQRRPRDTVPPPGSGR